MSEGIVVEPPTPAPTGWYSFGRGTCAGFLRLYNRLEVRGSEKLPAEGPFLFVANHQSFFDIPILGAATRRHMAFVARKSLADGKMMAWWLWQTRSILVKRGAADRGALRLIEAHLRAGDAVAVFPEGTRSADGELGKPRGGAFFAAKRVGCPIFPAGIRGAIDAWPRSAILPRPKKIVLEIGDPLDGGDPDAPERTWEAVRTLVGNGRLD